MSHIRKYSFFCVFVNLFGAFSGATASAFLTYRIWQGESGVGKYCSPILLTEFIKNI